MNLVNICGLTLNFIGTLLIVFYIHTDHKEYIENESGQSPGEKWYALYVKHPYWLYVGIVFVAVGFIFGIIAEITK